MVLKMGTAQRVRRECFFLLSDGSLLCLLKELLLYFREGCILEILDRFVNTIEGVQVSFQFKALLTLGPSSLSRVTRILGILRLQSAKAASDALSLQRHEICDRK